MSGSDDRIVIAGVGHTAYGKLPGRSITSLNVEACRRALADADVEKSVVDAVFTKSITSGFERFFGQKLAEALGLQPRMGGLWDQGGASNVTLICLAAAAIQAGHCDVALVSYGDNPRTGTRSAYERPLASAEAPYGWFGVLSGYAMIAQRHLQQYGTTTEQLASIAVACRKHGASNPDAHLRKPLTIEEHQSADYVVEPLRRHDCCLISDSGAAVVVMTERRARELGVPAPVPVLGFGHGQTSWEVAQRPDLTSTAAAVAGARVFEAAGLRPDDIDVAQLYDCFTITVLMTLEDYGFCPKGQGGRFVEDGALEIGGRLPVNTSGGLLSETGTPGMQLVIEAVRQMRGTAVNQVPGAKHALVTNQGGAMHTHASMILGN
ncbi:MAG: thiolase family protein [Streptosporangiales bacterium]|nr:thiolase family protein [Streptosporangiales bacterium]